MPTTSLFSSTPEPKPLVSESSTSESIQVESAMNDLKDELLIIPDYQRDADQWDDTMKSLFVESIINNLTVPAFFFEPSVGSDGVERNEVVDGQQRLTTLEQFWNDRFSLVSADDASYLTPNSVHYAGKYFNELPVAYKQAFKRYRLTVIKLRDLREMRLEIFRRINQGGTPLSAQDIRLAYYGDSKTVTLIRLSGIHDQDSTAATRMLSSAKSRFGFTEHLWNGNELDSWSDWWGEKRIANGQTASEMLLWSIVSAWYLELDQLLGNAGALRDLKVQYHGAIDEALDACCAQFRYQDHCPDEPALLPSFDELSEEFIPFFRRWFHQICGVKGVSLPVNKHRFVASAIGAGYRQRAGERQSDEAWGKIIEMIRRPRDWELPQSRGRWIGARGYKTQFEAVHRLTKKFLDVQTDASSDPRFAAVS